MREGRTVVATAEKLMPCEVTVSGVMGLSHVPNGAGVGEVIGIDVIGVELRERTWMGKRGGEGFK